MKTATRANRADTPAKRSRSTSALPDVVMASHPWASSTCIPGLPTPIEYRLVDRGNMRIGGTDGLQRRTGRAHPQRIGPQEEHRGEEDVRLHLLLPQRQCPGGGLEGRPDRPPRP